MPFFFGGGGGGGGDTPAQERQSCLATTGGSQLCASAGIGHTPSPPASLIIYINGLADYPVGDGTKASACYLSADGGTTPRALAAIAAGDQIYSGTTASYMQTLATDDKITLVYTW